MPSRPGSSADRTVLGRAHAGPARGVPALAAVSSSNLDLVRSIFGGWERGDFSSTQWAHPDIEYVFADGPSPGSWTGVAGMTKGARDCIGAWEEHRVEARA